MTVGSQVKQCSYSLKSAEQGLINLSVRTQEEDAQKILIEAAAILGEVITDLNIRVGQLEFEEPQYKGF
ncbi:DUF1657 domain-containing protein [Calidifontibacillus oryziterrae]|uniref:DUF1657 domain-containing protein n=1 Tax=Calidifontibacillus oryziterrae TaxID=1191699 RepID=UPI00031A8602|nr:DUF1657 domain-containing protein [Calidifontibacillus oryziterrae]